MGKTSLLVSNHSTGLYAEPSVSDVIGEHVDRSAPHQLHCVVDEKASRQTNTNKNTTRLKRLCVVIKQRVDNIEAGHGVLPHAAVLSVVNDEW
jgi:hypothetical protein